MEVSSHSLFLLQQLNVQREFGFLCDCTVAIGNVYFKAHRAVLAAFSNYFKMIFIHQSSECIKIQPTDIQPDVFSYLLHIMYTGMGPKQQVEPSRLQEGIKFLHAYQLGRTAGDGAQDNATQDALRMSNLYGIQISSQPGTKEGPGPKGVRSERAGGRSERSRLQPTGAGLGGLASAEGRGGAEHRGVSSVACGGDPVAAVTVKQEQVEMEVSGAEEEGAASGGVGAARSPALKSPSPYLGSGDSPGPLRCSHCGERCGGRRGSHTQPFAHAAGCPLLGSHTTIAGTSDSPGEASKGAGEELEELEGARAPPAEGEEPQLAGVGVGVRRPGGGPAAEPGPRGRAGSRAAGQRGRRRGGSPRSRKRRIICAVCGQRFAQKSQLQEHMYSHTGRGSRYSRYSRLCSQLIQASQHLCETQAELAPDESPRDGQDNGSSCYSLDSEISQESIDTFVVE
ncbi:hypothetical protein AGOR_G00088350 [Albula goreensis]|uniref:Zinc finger and BTB domain-containing protein 25 n=1 Tax=Albula goreensis TaxID=1534307 RepID=A0A8T3DP10_9TELE|nr:hypothetical protein AGOR_G00088350 [Albula goreensis]